MRFSLFLMLLVITFAVSCFNPTSAKEEVEIKTIAELWKTPLTKVKAVNAFKESGKLRGDRIVDTWHEVIAKVQAGAKLKALDTSGKKWKSAVKKLKSTGQLRNINEAKAAKITEGVAQEVVKNPSKWRYVKKALVITYGAALTALILVGLNAMFD